MLERKTATAPLPWTFTDDDPEGTVWALVAVTGGDPDDVGDVIEVGAFWRSVARRGTAIKGLFGYDWSRQVARVAHIEELSPGDPRLPAHLAPGQGGLLVKAVFNLRTADGRDAYEQAKFHGPDTCYSIGYKAVRSRTVGGVRRLAEVDLFEFSPVMAGAHIGARQLAVKSAGRPAGLETKRMPVPASVPRTRSAGPVAGRKIFPFVCDTCGGPGLREHRPRDQARRQPRACRACLDAHGLDPAQARAEGRGVLTAAELAQADELGRITSEDAYAQALRDEVRLDAEPDGELRRARPGRREWSA